MNLWGATPLLLAALLGGHHAGATPAASPSPTISASPSPTPHPAALAASSAVLTQVGPGKWQTTVLLDPAIASKCPQRSDFTLETTAPDMVIPKPKPRAGPHAYSPPHRYCRRISLSFSGLNQVPQSAVLVLRAPGAAVTAIPASFSRPVSLHDYFVVPFYAGAAMVLALLLLTLIFVKVRDRAGAVVRPFCITKHKIREIEIPAIGSNSAFWQWTVMASGAWTVNDSWATNIATITALLTGVFGTTSAASTIFPGVALDRFALVTVLVGVLIAAVPLAFAILYARWNTRFPGPTTDTTIVPQIPLKKNDVVTLVNDTPVTWRGGISNAQLTARSTIKLRRNGRRGAFAVVMDGSPVSLAAAQGPAATLASGTVIAPIPRDPEDQQARAIRAHSPLAANTRFHLDQAAVVVSPKPFRWMRVRSGQRATPETDLPAGPHGMPALGANTQVSLAAGAVATFDARPRNARMTGVATQDRAATLPAGAKVKVVPADQAVPAGRRARISGRCQVTLTGLAGADARTQEAFNQVGAAADTAGQPVVLTVPAGATITLPGGAALGAIKYPDEWPLQVKDGTAIQVPPGGTIRILAGNLIALPGGSDLLVEGESALDVDGQDAALSVAAANVAPPPKPPPPEPEAPPDLRARILAWAGRADDGAKPDPADVPLPCPVFLAAPSGAKITVIGTADVELPTGLAMTAPRRRAYALGKPLHLTVPMPANTLGAPMRLVILAALMTAFGAGAQLGIAGLLLYDFSDASTLGRRIALGLIGLIGAFVLYYATTAIRALADPQPGSSMSAVPGTSFTL